MLTVNQIKINVLKFNNSSEMDILNKHISKLLALNENQFEIIKILKKSIDARKKPEIFYLYSVVISIKNNNKKNKLLSNNRLNLNIYKKPEYQYESIKPIDKPFSPIIVGSGPAGLFAAYSLIQSGVKPIIIERGKPVHLRDIDVNEFWDKGILNTNSNVQFGEGGAGTYSDGKLNTGIKDKSGRITEVLNIFHKFGAPLDITYINKPHIGTDVLKTVITNLRNYLEENGAVYRFNTCLKDLVIDKDKLTKIVLESDNITEELDCNSLILAIGHSARDTFEMLFSNNIPMTNKPFAVGLRVMHNQKLINNSQYGDTSAKLPAADYKLTTKVPSGRGVYSFCMCPGGYVVNASSENNRLCVNGMSYHDRDSKTSNSAIVVTIDETDFGPEVLDGMHFQRKLEENAYNINNGQITIQKLIDYKNNKESIDTGSTVVSIKGQYKTGNITSILPANINEDIVNAFEDFGHTIKGFDSDDAILCGIEARTSSPVKILRDDNCQSNIKGIYPCGEGAGYAGGITSAAADGLKVANSLVVEYNNTHKNY